MKKIATILILFITVACSNEQNKKQNNISIDGIPKMSNPTSAIIELDERINELSNYGDNLSKLTEPQKVFWFIENLEREVNNGGFNQFYYNSSGDYAHETFKALRTIGAIKMSEIVNKANSAWPNQTVPKDRTERQNIQETIGEQANTVWELCDNQFYEYPDNITELLLKYVNQNKADFE